MPSLRIMIAAGGTGGHVFPALAVAKHLAQQQVEIHWLGSPKGIENTVVPANGIPLHILSVKGLRGSGILRLVKAPFMLLSALLQAISVLRKIKPHAILGMGGFAAGPGCLAAKLLGIPVVVHEQNAVPGFTNTMSARFATRKLEAFEGAFVTKSVRGAEFVGNPVRAEIIEAAGDYQGQSPFNVLIVGGSLGAVALNQLLPKVMKRISGRGLEISVRHQCGKGRAADVSVHYQGVSFECDVSDFIDDMAAAYRWADIVVCRAGAMTVAELAVAGRPAIFIPFPYAVDDHQTANANWLASRGAAYVFQQHQLSEDELSNKLVELMNTPAKLQHMATAAKMAAKTDATEKVSQCLLEVSHG